jgi:DNA polymerase (family 10)
MVDEDRLQEVDGIGKAIAEKITTLIRTGRLEYYEKLRDEFPPEIFVLFELQGLGAKKIKALYETLGISSITKLERACKEGKVAALPGFGAKTSENILKAIEQRRKHRSISAGGCDGARGQLLRLRSTRRLLSRRSQKLPPEKGIVRDLDLIVSTRKPPRCSRFRPSSPG